MINDRCVTNVDFKWLINFFSGWNDSDGGLRLDDRLG